MPKKSRRVASRQAQLSGRAKRVRAHGPPGSPTTTPPRPAQESRADGQAPAQTLPLPESEPPMASPPTNTVPTTPAPHPRPRARVPQGKPIETYVIPELWRIGIVSAVIFVIMAVLVFVLVLR